MKCPYCGEKIKRDSNICDYCGGKIEIDTFSADQKENSGKNDRIPWFYQMWFISIVFWAGLLLFGLGPIIATILYTIRIAKYSKNRKLAVISGTIQACIQGGILLVLLLFIILAVYVPLPEIDNSVSENVNQTEMGTIGDSSDVQQIDNYDVALVEEDDWYIESTEVIDENNDEPEKPLAEGEDLYYKEMQIIRANALDYGFSGDIGKTIHCGNESWNGDVTLKEVFLVDSEFTSMYYDYEKGEFESLSDTIGDDGLYMAVTFETENTIPLAMIYGYNVRSTCDDPNDAILPKCSTFLKYEDGSREIMSFYRIGTHNKNTNCIEIETMPDMFVFGYGGDFCFMINDEVAPSESDKGNNDKLEDIEEYDFYCDWSGDYSGGWMDTFLELSLDDSIASDGSCGTMNTMFRGMLCYWTLYYNGNGCLYAVFSSGDYDGSDYYVQMKYDSSDKDNKYIDMWSEDGTESVTFYKE